MGEGDGHGPAVGGHGLECRVQGSCKPSLSLALSLYPRLYRQLSITMQPISTYHILGILSTAATQRNSHRLKAAPLKHTLLTSIRPSRAASKDAPVTALALFLRLASAFLSRLVVPLSFLSFFLSFSSFPISSIL